MLTEVNDLEKTASTATIAVLTVSHLYKAFGENSVLVDFNLCVNKGESVIVLGKSGSGKSVLIKCIIGLLKPDKGSIRIFDRDIADLSHDQFDQVRAKVGFLFQSNALYDSMTVRENLEFPLRRHWMKLKAPDIQKMVMESLEDVGLPHTVDMMPAELSGGMRKRIALARTLILKPDVILYDEPTTGLDPITAKEIINLMIEIQKKYQTTSLIISHDMNCVRLAGSRVIVLINGSCYAGGSYEELKNSSDPSIQSFFE
jgi:phospholipid/cholesterol/gamma-HCH transport system ATP-binding protein